MSRIECSFRDPSGNVHVIDGRVIRFIKKGGLSDWDSLVGSGLLQGLERKGFIQETHMLTPDESKNFIDRENADDISCAVEHDLMPVISYPYEWSFAMLKDAAILYLNILNECLENDFTLKDGTSYNMQFISGSPIFIDILSIVPLRKSEVWVGFKQFCQLFLFPLMIMSYKGIPFHQLLKGESEGIDVLLTSKFFSTRDIFKRGVFVNIFLQALLQKSFSSYKESLKEETRRAHLSADIIQKNVSGLKRVIQKLPDPIIPSAWDGYDTDNSYDQKVHDQKCLFVEEAVSSVRPATLMDLGCNTGEYSLIASKYASYILAVDSDHNCVDKLYKGIKRSNIKNILPLVMDITNPSPDHGWKLTEYNSFFKRVSADMILCLALIHHIVIAKNVPLKGFLAWLTTLAKDIIVEFVCKEDPMAQMLLKDKEDIYPDYTVSDFEKHLEKYCEVKEKRVLTNGTRILYWIRNRS